MKYCAEKMMLHIRRLWSNRWYYIELFVLSALGILVLYFLRKISNFSGYFDNILVGTMGSVVASIVFLGVERTKSFNADCIGIAEEITILFNDIGYTDDSNKKYVKSYSKYINDFKSTYRYIFRINASYGINSHITKVCKAFFNVIEKLKSADGDEDISCSLHDIYNMVGKI